jgi:Tol biopolymer transport system component
MKAGWRIFVMASDGGQVRQLTSNDSDDVVPHWSRDGNWIYYASNRTGRYEIWRAPAKGGNGVQVTREGGWFASESHDGNLLYYTKNLDNRDAFSDLWKCPLPGGEETMILRSINSRQFDVRADGIYFLPHPAAEGVPAVRFYDFATRKDREIAPVKGFAGSLAVSPDRKTFLLDMVTRTGANVMIVDNFR